jgi:hypothetical protein
MTNQAKLIVLGHAGLVVLCLVPLLEPYEGMYDVRLVLFGPLSALALSAGLAYAAGWPFLAAIFDTPLLVLSLALFLPALGDDRGPWGVLSRELLWSGPIVAVTAITVIVGLVDGLRWVRQTFGTHPETDARTVFLRPGDRGRPGD